jgi:hypothetical protein
VTSFMMSCDAGGELKFHHLSVDPGTVLP